MSRYKIDLAHGEVAQQAVEFASEYTRKTSKLVQPHQSNIFVDLVAQSRTLTKIAIDECNGIMRKQPSGHRKATWDEKDQQRANQSRDIAQKHVALSVNAIFGPSALVKFHGDPRGCSVEICHDTHVFRLDGGYQ